MGRHFRGSNSHLPCATMNILCKVFPRSDHIREREGNPHVNASTSFILYINGFRVKGGFCSSTFPPPLSCTHTIILLGWPAKWYGSKKYGIPNCYLCVGKLDCPFCSDCCWSIWWWQTKWSLWNNNISKSSYCQCYDYLSLVMAKLFLCLLCN